MPSKKRWLRMMKDDLVWEKIEEVSNEWEKRIHKSVVYHAIASLILKYREGKPKELHLGIRGGYNVVYRLEYADGLSVILRMPIEGVVQFPEEKLRYEAATLRYIAANTNIPVPCVYYCGTAAENPTGLGPFIIMKYIKHDKVMTEVLKDPNQEPGDYPILDPNIDEEKLEHLYSQMANILLQLSNLRFPRIGSLIEDSNNEISVSARPLTQNMNDVVEFTNMPPSLLPTPSQTFSSAGDWYMFLADLHMKQLAFQHNDAVEDEEDARDKYVARQLFRNLAREGSIPTSSVADDDFRLWSEDLTPSNVLVDSNLRVVGVVDWEFAHAAPADFVFDPPWWLLLLEPEYWTDGYESFKEAYEPRLKTFLKVLEAEERKMAASLDERVRMLSLNASRKTESPLSQRMRESWEKGTWMTNYAARKSWAFDFIWWKYLDERYFGPNENQDYPARLRLLSEPQAAVMDSFVARKMEEKENREIVEWDDWDAVDLLDEVLV
ncbi:kinase-like domain-containing protein [Hypoxylon sp. FL0543]|nr:kinase-like domain-containing protein [Hypoxylon sp. FL0543]